MIRIGITGGIGSGKSVVSRIMTVMGIPVYNSDAEARRLMNTDFVIREELISLLGEGVYREGELNKPLLSSYLFANPENANRINSIVHPRVREDFCQWASDNSLADILAQESAILFESGFADMFDKTVMVYAPLEIRVARVMQRDGLSEEAVLQRVQRQMDDDRKKLMADYVIVNDDITPLIPQVEKLVGSIRSRF